MGAIEAASPTSEKTPTENRRRAPSLRTIGISLLSILFVTLIVSYIFSPVSVSLADQMTVSRISSRSTVFYGKVTDTSNRPIRNARVVIYHYSKGRQRIDSIVYTGANGTYRKVLNRTGRTYIQMSVKVGGKLVKSKPRRLTVTRGHAYRVSAKLVRRSVLTFVPLFSY